MLMKKIISTFLALLMLVGALSTVISATAAETTGPVYEYNTNKYTATMNYLTGEYERKDENGNIIETIKVDTKEEKLDVMDLRLEYAGYRLYVDAYSGEVAVENVATGDVMFSNPYDLGAQNIDEKTKVEMLSQIIIAFDDTSDNDDEDPYNSYTYAVKGGLDGASDNVSKQTASQIDVKYIQNGIRVEYQIGRTDSRYLVPEFISGETYDREFANIFDPENTEIDDFERNQFSKFLTRKNLKEYLDQFKKEDIKEKNREAFLALYPFAANYPDDFTFYECTCAVKSEYVAIESIIKAYCPDYTFEDMDSEHLDLGVSVKEMNEPLFKISIEYTLDKSGFTVRVPANGIRFDESIYRLDEIKVLPYMGVGSNPNPGYTFFPDGSGALFDFQQLAKVTGDVYFHGDVYSQDFAYSTISTVAPHNQIVRYPVFGLVETETLADGTQRSRGYTAIVEEGESLMTLSSYHTTSYNSILMTVKPRAFDVYELSDAISVGGSAPFIVVSPRKYTGDFRIRYVMLTDPKVKTGEGYYDTSYVGMANAYRDYLVANKVLTKLTEADVQKDIPLYIETFGAIETTEKFMSIPYDTMKPLTSFGDVASMYDTLAAAGVKNINFILTGYSKGGLSVDKIPYKLNWDKTVEKGMDFEELLKYADDKGFSLYPDYDFVFVSDNGLFDGLSLMSHAVKTIDDRYTSKREYSASRQAYINYFELAISPAYFSRFYEKLTGDLSEYDKYKSLGISVSTMGSYLNSDFDEDEPYHREDSKGHTMEAFSYFDEHYNKVMTSGGNAYTWKYVDHITDIAIDSSRHARSSATVPFLGIVLHGYVQTAGTPVNMEGNIDYAMLRAIENGSALQFVLSYRNTALLKENEDTSVYYSVRYDIWVDDVIARYNEINEALKGVQTSTIDVHQFVDGLRIPSEKEIQEDAFAELFDTINKNINDAAQSREELRDMLQKVRSYLKDWDEKYMSADFATAEKIYASKATVLAELKTAKATLEAAKIELEAKKHALAAAEAAVDEAKADLADAEAALKEAEEKLAAAQDDAALKAAVDTAKQAVADAKAAVQTASDNAFAPKAEFDVANSAASEALELMLAKYDEYKTVDAQAKAVAAEYIEKYEFARDNFAELKKEENKAYTTAIIEKLEEILNATKATYEALVELADDMSKAAEDSDVLAIEKEYAEEIGVDVEDKVENETVVKESYNKYSVPENSIVYERYANGKEFILNFNNYSVKVLIGGVYYTVDAYGYVIIN